MQTNRPIHLLDSPDEPRTECGRLRENLPVGSVTTRREVATCSRCKVANYSIGCFGGDDREESYSYA